MVKQFVQKRSKTQGKRQWRIQRWLVLHSVVKLMNCAKNAMHQMATIRELLSAAVIVARRWKLKILGHGSTLEKRVHNEVRYLCQSKTNTEYGLSGKPRAIQVVVFFLKTCLVRRGAFTYMVQFYQRVEDS